ncbi:hypothetical protein TNCV_3045441 [Trichonephila clavipes]|nr:hypothetical protein TNCV_3045441 [Trichonephila clavipes]
MGLHMDDNAPCHRTVAAEQLLESEDIERMDCRQDLQISTPSSMFGIFLSDAWQLVPTTSNDSGASRLALQRRMGSNASTTH